MKGRESGMPEETYWASFFAAGAVVDKMLGPREMACDIVEFGCGYGTFTIPAARRTTGRVIALDIELAMISRVQEKALALGLHNIQTELRDFVAHSTGLGACTQGHALIFNLLHLEQPVALLREAHRILGEGGRLSVMHWRSDIPTPRGPSLAIRPVAEQCRSWMIEAGFHSVQPVDLQSCCPFHYGLTAIR